MSTDFRALCAELVGAWDDAAGDQDFLAVAEIMDLSRAALAQPEPAGPGELGELVKGLRRIADGMSAFDLESDSWVAARAAALLAQQVAQPEAEEPTDEELLGCMLKAAALVPGGQCTGILDWDKEAIAAARAVLARWGRRTPPPRPQPPGGRMIIEPWP